MTDKKSENKADSTSTEAGDNKNPEEDITTKKGMPRDFVFFALVLLIVIAGGFFLYNKIQNINLLTQSLSGNTSSHAEDVNNRIQKIEKNIGELSTQMEVLKNSVADLYKSQPGSNEDWALSEAEYLLVIATHRLLLEKDVGTALVAMEAALKRIESPGATDLMPVREQLVSDINKLKAVNTVDITGLSIYLADLVERASKLPIKKSVITSEKSGKPEDARTTIETGWSGILDSIWQELKSLVIIKRSDEVKQELLLPDEEYFLYQNLRLELESARLAALRRDTENFHASIILIIDWLNQYYETSDNGVMNILDTLKQMSSVKLDPELPDIDSSLETLRAYIHNQETSEPLMGEDK